MATYTDEALVLSSGLSTKMAATDQLGFSLSIIVADGKGLQGVDATSDVTMTLGDAAGATNFIVADSGAVSKLVCDSDGNVSIAGNLDVTGNIISRDEERVLIADNFLDINFGYSSATALEGGIAVNYLAVAGGLSIDTTANTLTFSAQDGATNPKVVASTASGIPNATFAVGDIIQIAGTTNAENDGFYIVLTNTLGQIEVEDANDGISFKAAQVNFTAEAETTSAAVTIFQVNVNILQTSSTGAWQVQNGNTDADFATFTPLGTSTLQQAYDAGSTIVTDATGDIIFTLSEDAQGFSVNGFEAGDGDVEIGGTLAVNSIKLGNSGAASEWVSTGQNLTLQTATSGTLAVTSAASLDLDGDAVTINGTSASHLKTTSAALSVATITAGALDVTSAGTLSCTGAGTSTFGDDTDTIVYNGSGAMTQTATGASSVTVTSGNYSIATATSGSVDIDAVTNVTVDGAAITIGGDVDSAAITIGSTAAVAHAIIVDSGNSNVTIGGDGTMKLGDSSSTSVTLNAASSTAVVDLQVAGTSFLKVDGTNAKISALRSLSLDTASTASAPTQAVSVALIADEGLNKGEIVYISAAGQVTKADSNSGSAGDAIRTPVGVCMTNITDTVAGGIGVGGVVPVKFADDGDGNVLGTPVYLSPTAGVGVQIPPVSGTIFQIGILHTVSASNLGLVIWQPRKVADQA